MGNQLWTKNVVVGLEKENAVAVVKIMGYCRIQRWGTIEFRDSHVVMNYKNDKEVLLS